MSHEDLRRRTYRFALAVSNATRPILPDAFGKLLGSQLIRSAWSVAANYRVTRHARSRADFVSKMSLVAEEGEESSMWLEGLQNLELLHRIVVEPLRREAGELTAIAVASIRTAKQRAKRG
jgi:four helix bundle protein